MMMAKQKMQLAEPNCEKCLDKEKCKAFKAGKFYVICQVSGGARISEKADYDETEAYKQRDKTVTP